MNKKKDDDILLDEIVAHGDAVDRAFNVLVPKEDSINLVRYSPIYILSGDTDSAYVSLESKFKDDSDVEEVVTFANNLAKTVNASFPSFMKKVFNSNEDQSNIIQTEREVVSDKSYFIAKKNYIMHYIDKEGVRKSDYKIMGLAIKRSDTPKIVKDFLRMMLDMIMDKTAIQDINAAIVTFKKQYMQASFLDVGRPMAVKELAKYEHKYDVANDMKGFPYHIRASMYYNFMCGHNDIKIRSGNKIKVVYIKHPEIKYIAVPADADVLPKFLDDIKIDWESQWEKVVKKINLYLVPLDMVYQDETDQLAFLSLT